MKILSNMNGFGSRIILYIKNGEQIKNNSLTLFIEMELCDQTLDGLIDEIGKIEL